MSASDRLCCKSRKLQSREFSRKIQSEKQSPIRIISIALAKSLVSLMWGDEAPHIFTRKPRQLPLEFLSYSAKRLLQHNLPVADIGDRWQRRPLASHSVFGILRQRAAPIMPASAIIVSTARNPPSANAMAPPATPMLPPRNVQALIMPEPRPACAGERADSASRGAEA